MEYVPHQSGLYFDSKKPSARKLRGGEQGGYRYAEVNLECTHYLVYMYRYHSYALISFWTQIYGALGIDKYIHERSLYFRPVLRGGIVIRTHEKPKKQYIPLFLHTMLGPDCYVPP